MSPHSSSLSGDLNGGPITDAKGLLSMTIGKDQVEELQGRTITLKATITNFLSNTGTNETVLEFGSTKTIEIIDVANSYNFNPKVDNALNPRFRFPYCSSESASVANQLQSEIKSRCYLYNAAGTHKI